MAQHKVERMSAEPVFLAAHFYLKTFQVSPKPCLPDFPAEERKGNPLFRIIEKISQVALFFKFLLSADPRAIGSERKAKHIGTPPGVPSSRAGAGSSGRL